jgi:hypothetical protein
MTPFLSELIRAAAALAGGTLGSAFRRNPTGVHWLYCALAGISAGLFLEPTVTEAVADTANVVWLQSNSDHSHWAMTFILGVVGNTLIRGMILGAENVLPEWLWTRIGTFFGVPQSQPFPRRSYEPPDSDVPVATRDTK